MDGDIYLDYNATTPVAAEVREAMLPWLGERYGNPSSGHRWGRLAKAAVESARAEVAALIGCESSQICFTSGGTESNNLAIRGTLGKRTDRRTVVTTAVEHPATLAPLHALEATGVTTVVLDVDREGIVQLDSKPWGEDVALATVMHANNETGVVQPASEIAQAAHQLGAWFHVDAAQTIGKLAVDVHRLDCDLLSIAGHKLYAPPGVGALFVRQAGMLVPFVRGGGHEGGLRPGTENVPGIVGLGAACTLAKGRQEEDIRRWSAMRDRLWDRLRKKIEGLRLSGQGAPRLPNTLNLQFPGVRGAKLLDRLPCLMASTGAACHAEVESGSAVLLAMGYSNEEALGAIRLSMGRATTDSEIDRAAELLIEAHRELSKRSER